ncbi:MAG: type II toxin-antitoxin system RelE/ParE family toxin, partial [Alphaproteobacteria bacterium]|nr:type II toxin-antitoxin system RelE/ParE family toxin [Alphaproteobacteria bacterium]
MALKLDLSKRARKFLDQLPPKQFRQVVGKLFDLMADPQRPDVQPLKGSPFSRADIGEYRIVFAIDAEGDTLKVPLIGNR